MHRSNLAVCDVAGADQKRVADLANTFLSMTARIESTQPLKSCLRRYVTDNHPTGFGADAPLMCAWDLIFAAGY
jgi:hypothetical protein